MKEVRVKSVKVARKRLVLFVLFAVCGTTFYLLLARLGFLVPVSQLPAVLCLPACKSEQPVHPLMAGEQLLNHTQPLSQLVKGNIAEQKTSILIEKSKHRLTLFYNLQPIKSYPVVFGSNPTGDKLHEGDRKTPEGIFHIQDLYPHSDWSKFMWLDYPTSRSWQKHFQAKLTGKINWLLPIGGQIGIHGVPSGDNTLIDQRSNWTWGCISLKNRDVDEIYQVVKRETLVEIVP